MRNRVLSGAFNEELSRALSGMRNRVLGRVLDRYVIGVLNTVPSQSS